MRGQIAMKSTGIELGARNPGESMRGERGGPEPYFGDGKRSTINKIGDRV